MNYQYQVQTPTGRITAQGTVKAVSERSAKLVVRKLHHVGNMIY